MPGSILPLAATVAGYYFGGPIGALVASLVVSQVFPPKKPKLPEAPSLAQQATLVTSRQPAAPWQVIYGQARVGGVITFMESALGGAALHLVVTFAGHEVQEIGDIYFDDELVPIIDGSGNVSGRYANHAAILKSTGSEAAGVQPFPGLVSQSAGVWTTTHCQTGRAKIHVALVWNPSVFPNGLPNISAVIKGKKVRDPRTSPATTAWSANPALCIADYLCDTRVGLGAVYEDEIDEAQLIAAANICSESVALNSGSPPTLFETRYELHGAFDASVTPREILGRMLTAMGGKARYLGGRWWIFPAAYRTPTVTLTADDLRGQVHIQPRLSRRDLCNGVKGLYVSADNMWQPTDFPPVTNATYLSDDQGERIWLDIDLQFTKSAACAQRLAKIELERVRQQITVELQCKLTAWRNQPGDVVLVTLDRYGYSAKPFEVMESTLVHEEDGEGGTRLGVDLLLRETASSVYDWNAGEEVTVDPAPDTNLPDPFANLEVTGLTASSGTTDLFVNGDGTVVPRVRLRWTAPGNAFVKYYEIQSARSSGSPQAWVDAPDVAAPATEGFAFPVEDGVAYDLRVRALTALGNASEYVYVRGHTVVGKTELPSDVTGASAVQTRGIVVMGCDAVTDADLDSIEVRLHDEGETDFENASPIGNILRGQTVTSAAVPPGTWELLFKAKDTSGNYSANAARVTITVTAEGFTTIESEPQAVTWPGSLTNMVRHWTGVLTPESQSLASALGWEVFDEYVPNAEAHCYYEAPVIDKAIDATARVYGDVVSVLGPGETSGIAAPGLEVDTRLAAGSFDGFEAWTVGSVGFRFLKARIHVDTSVGKPVISQFTPTIDAEAREETGTYTTPAGGSVAVSFAMPFHVTPVGTVSPQGSGDVTASYASLTTSGFDGYFKTAGAGGAGTASYRFTGA